MWGRGKLEAVRAWAADAGIDLKSSWAYSDSYYDAPLLDAVGHPTAVNADLRLVALARLKGWPLRHFDLPEGVLKIAGRELQEWTRPLQRPELLANVRLDIAGIENIPKTGPVIAVFNHRSYFDATVVGTVLGADRAVVPLPRQEGGLRRPGHRVPVEDGRRHPRSTARRGRTSRSSTPSAPCRPARPWRWRPRAPSRVARRSSRPS